MALFIDAENSAPKDMPLFLEECQKRGRPAILRCYGNQEQLTKWKKVMAEHHLMPVMTPPAASEKSNSSDFALTIDAVSLLHRDLFDCAVIASSDADFVQLAMHIREHGKSVYGVGRHKALASLKKAFDGYTTTDKPATKVATVATKPTKTAPAPKSAGTLTDSEKQRLNDVFDKLSAEGKAVSLSALGKELKEPDPDYLKGHGGLARYLEKSGLFEVKGQTVSRRGARS